MRHLQRADRPLQYYFAERERIAHHAIGLASARRSARMPEGPNKAYIRAEGLSVLATEAVLDRPTPLAGYLNILTEDGPVRLALTGSAAADLLIDLKNFLALEQ